MKTIKLLEGQEYQCNGEIDFFNGIISFIDQASGDLIRVAASAIDYIL